MKEQERKFRLKRLPEHINEYLFKDIKQGYLIIHGDRHLRVRIVDDKKAFICFKTIESKWVRNEYEYEIPIEDARELINSSQAFLFKKLYTTTYKGNHIDIDVYPSGLIIGEIEFEDADNVEIPPYFWEEVTGQSKYANMVMAVHGTWK